MKYELLNPFLVGLHQIDHISSLRDGCSETRSYKIDKKWCDDRVVSANGLLEEHHLYFVVSRRRARFAPLADYPCQHFLFNSELKKSPVEINFEHCSESEVYVGEIDLNIDELTNTLLHGFKDRLGVGALVGIVGQPMGQPFVTAASFFFGKENINVRCSPDLWRFVSFPGALKGEGPISEMPFDFRVEYIGKTINFAEDRLTAHDHARRVQADLASQEPNREAFVVMYQVDYESNAGCRGVGNRESQLELEAAEAILIQYFKPRYNIRSISFSLSEKNDDPLDELLASKMRMSGNFCVGCTEITLKSPAYHFQECLAWGRFFSPLHPKTYSVNTVKF